MVLGTGLVAGCCWSFLLLAAKVEGVSSGSRGVIERNEQNEQTEPPTTQHTAHSIACRGDALHAGHSDTLFELAWVWLCRREAGAVEGFGGRARRVPRSLACGMCVEVCIMTAAAVDSSSII